MIDEGPTGPSEIPPPMQLELDVEPSDRMTMVEVLSCNDIGALILMFMPLNVASADRHHHQNKVDGGGAQGGPIPPSLPIQTLLGARLIHRPMLDLVARVVSDAMNNALLTSAPTRYCLQTDKTPVNVRLVGWNIDQGIAATALESLSRLPKEEFFMPFTLLVVTSHNMILRYEFARHIFQVLTETAKDCDVVSTTRLVSLWPRSCPVFRLLARWIRRYSPRALALRDASTSDGDGHYACRMQKLADGASSEILDGSPTLSNSDVEEGGSHGLQWPTNGDELGASLQTLTLSPSRGGVGTSSLHRPPAANDHHDDGEARTPSGGMKVDEDWALLACLDRRLHGPSDGEGGGGMSRPGSSHSSQSNMGGRLLAGVLGGSCSGAGGHGGLPSPSSSSSTAPRTGMQVMDLHYHFLSRWDLTAEDLCWSAAGYAQYTGFTGLPRVRNVGDAGGDRESSSSTTIPSDPALDPATLKENAIVIDRVAKMQQAAPFAIDAQNGSEDLQAYKPLLDAAFGVITPPMKTTVPPSSPGMGHIPGRSTTPSTTPLDAATSSHIYPTSTSFGSPTGSFAGGMFPRSVSGEEGNNESFSGLIGGESNSAFDIRSSSTVTFFEETQEALGQRNSVQLYCHNDKLQTNIDLTPSACHSLTLYGASGVSESAPRFSLAPKKKGDAIKINLPKNIEWLGLSAMPTLREVTFQYATMSCIVFSALPMYQDCYWCLDAKNAVRSVHSFSVDDAEATGGGITAVPLSSIAEAARDRMAKELRGANEGWTTLRGPWL